MEKLRDERSDDQPQHQPHRGRKQLHQRQVGKRALRFARPGAQLVDQPRREEPEQHAECRAAYAHQQNGRQRRRLMPPAEAVPRLNGERAQAAAERGSEQRHDQSQERLHAKTFFDNNTPHSEMISKKIISLSPAASPSPAKPSARPAASCRPFPAGRADFRAAGRSG